MFTHHIIFVTLVAMALLSTATLQTCRSAGTPGLPGIPGIPGRDGREGEKGEKGAPGVPLKPGQMPQKGQKGERGPSGMPGKIGRSGPQGPPGAAGKAGTMGDSGSVGVYKLELQSAFSVTRRTPVHPAPKMPVRFPTVITNLNNHFDVATGKFVCQIPGTYYFVYHASSDAPLCIALVRDGKEQASFCDHMTNTFQASSGGLTVYLEKDQAVWLETNENNGMVGMDGKQSIFSGFLLYPN